MAFKFRSSVKGTNDDSELKGNKVLLSEQIKILKA